MNLGEFMEAVTERRLKATRHRVLFSKDTQVHGQRQSIVFFALPSNEQWCPQKHLHIMNILTLSDNDTPVRTLDGQPVNPDGEEKAYDFLIGKITKVYE